nr:Xaa-Pro peptidase family protein [uncultured Bacillus sp.]
MKHSLTSFLEWMKQNDIDVSFISSTDNVFYLSGFYCEPNERLLGLLVFQEHEPILVVPGMEKEEAASSWTYDIIGFSDIDDPWQLINKAVKKRLSKVFRVAIEKEHMNVERYEAISSIFPKASFTSAEEKLRKLRMIKDSSELAALKQACKLADDAIEAGCAEIQEGKTEMDILAAIEYEMKKKGVAKMSFSTMVLTGSNAASPHGTPGLTKIKKGDLVLFDLGVVVDGYCSDITRTVAYGDINGKQKEIYETVLKAQSAAIESCKPGMTCAAIDLTARKIITDAGYGDFFPHRLGHGLGISVHEYPSVTEANSLILEPGMVFTIEPGIYVPHVAGVRIEDDVCITENGVEVLTKFPKQLTFIH